MMLTPYSCKAGKVSWLSTPSQLNHLTHPRGSQLGTIEPPITTIMALPIRRYTVYTGAKMAKPSANVILCQNLHTGENSKV